MLCNSRENPRADIPQRVLSIILSIWFGGATIAFVICILLAMLSSSSWPVPLWESGECDCHMAACPRFTSYAVINCVWLLASLLISILMLAHHIRGQAVTLQWGSVLLMSLSFAAFVAATQFPFWGPALPTFAAVAVLLFSLASMALLYLYVHKMKLLEQLHSPFRILLLSWQMMGWLQIFLPALALITPDFVQQSPSFPQYIVVMIDLVILLGVLIVVADLAAVFAWTRANQFAFIRSTRFNVVLQLANITFAVVNVVVFTQHATEIRICPLFSVHRILLLSAYPMLAFSLIRLASQWLCRDMLAHLPANSVYPQHAGYRRRRPRHDDDLEDNSFSDDDQHDMDTDDEHSNRDDNASARLAHIANQDSVSQTSTALHSSRPATAHATTAVDRILAGTMMDQPSSDVSDVSTDVTGQPLAAEVVSASAPAAAAVAIVVVRPTETALLSDQRRMTIAERRAMLQQLLHDSDDEAVDVEQKQTADDGDSGQHLQTESDTKPLLG